MNDTQEQKYFNYLDVLRESGVTNMFGAVPYLQAEFGLNAVDAKKILISWMKQFKYSELPVKEENKNV